MVLYRLPRGDVIPARRPTSDSIRLQGLVESNQALHQYAFTFGELVLLKMVVARRPEFISFKPANIPPILRHVIFAEFLLDYSRRSDGERHNNFTAVGFRYAVQI